jgi:hypothetical protein
VSKLKTVKKASLITQLEALKLLINQLIKNQKGFFDEAKIFGYISGALEIVDKVSKSSPTLEVTQELRLVGDVLEQQVINHGW